MTLKKKIFKDEMAYIDYMTKHNAKNDVLYVIKENTFKYHITLHGVTGELSDALDSIDQTLTKTRNKNYDYIHDVIKWIKQKGHLWMPQKRIGYTYEPVSQPDGTVSIIIHT